MRLKQHLIEGRGKPLKEDDFFDYVKKKCKDSIKAYKDGYAIYRGVNDNNDFLYIEPKKFTRVSTNTINLYTLIIDHNLKWKKYPKRSQSIICTNTDHNATMYGDLYHVFPIDGANYGICPEYDLWPSFSKTIGIPLDDFNGDIMRLAKGPLGLNDLSFKTFKDLVGLFKRMDERMVEFEIDPKDFVLVYTWLHYYEGSFLRLMNKLFDPKINGFKQTNKSPRVYKEDNREIWTDSPSYMVSYKWLQNNQGRLIS